MRKMTIAAIAAFTMMSAPGAYAQQTYHNIGNFGNSAPGGAPTLAINGFTSDGLHALPDDTTAATPTVTNSFVLTGTVAKDCSYYSGAPSGTTTIPLGAIGVRNGNTETVNNLFNQVAAFNVEITSTSAFRYVDSCARCRFSTENRLRASFSRSSVRAAGLQARGRSRRSFTASIWSGFSVTNWLTAFR